MNQNCIFSRDQLALIYESVKHLAVFRDVLDSDNYVGDISRDILGKIESIDNDVVNPNYVSENILD